MTEPFRSRFPIFATRTYLNSCSQGALSVDVAATLDRFRDSWHDLGSPWDVWMAEVERLRGRVAALIGADVDEIAIMPNASTAIAAVATALSFDGDRNEVVLGDNAFPTAGHVWLAQARRGARIRWTPPEDIASGPEVYRRAVSARTRIVSATTIGFRNGVRTDVAALVDLCRRHGAWLLVDDYQRTGTTPLDVHALGVDMLVTGALKYLLGASGVAFLYVRRGLIASLEPAVTGWLGRVNPFDFRADVLDWPASARRFETGSPPVPSVYAAVQGIDLVLGEGLASIETRIERLVSRLMKALESNGYGALTPAVPARRGPLVVIRSVDGDALTRRLAERGIVVSARGDGVRCSFHAYNSDADVDRLVDALHAEERLVVRV